MSFQTDDDRQADKRPLAPTSLSSETRNCGCAAGNACGSEYGDKRSTTFAENSRQLHDGELMGLPKMSLPDLSSMMQVGELRHIQAFYEEAGWRNPDVFVRHLLTPRQRAECFLRAWRGLRRLRTSPFYFYLLARTLYYRSVFAKAIEDGTRFIVNIGCGADTRAYRWRAQLVDRAVAVVECGSTQCQSSEAAPRPAPLWCGTC